MTVDNMPPGAAPDKEERIRQRAFELWVEEGRPEGRDREHWEQACRQIEMELKSGHPETANAPPAAPVYADPPMAILDPPVKTKTVARKKPSLKRAKP